MVIAYKDGLVYHLVSPWKRQNWKFVAANVVVGGNWNADHFEFEILIGIRRPVPNLHQCANVQSQKESEKKRLIWNLLQIQLQPTFGQCPHKLGFSSSGDSHCSNIFNLFGQDLCFSKDTGPRNRFIKKKIWLIFIFFLIFGVIFPPTRILCLPCSDKSDLDMIFEKKRKIFCWRRPQPK